MAVSVSSLSPVDFIMAIVAVVIVAVAFVAIWTPILRPAIFNLLNDANFTATWGTGLRDVGILVLDIVVFVVAFVILEIVLTNVIKKVKKATG